MLQKRSLLLLVILLLSGCSLLPANHQPLQPPLVEPVEITDSLEEVTRGNIRVSLSGTAVLESVRQSYLYLEESGGRVKEIVAKAGDRVKEGDLLIQLENNGLDRELLQREIEYERKRLALKDIRRNSKDQERVHLAELELELAQNWLEHTRQQVKSKQIRANMDGVITFMINMKPGDMTEAYRTLVIISDPNDLRLAYDSTSASSKLSAVRVGMEAELSLDDQAFTGTVVQTPSSAPFTEDERLRKTYASTLYIQSDQLPSEATMGSRIEMEIVLNEKKDVLIIPKSGLRDVMGRTFVQVMEGETRREVDIEVGLQTPSTVEIVSGLKAGQKIVMK